MLKIEPTLGRIKESATLAINQRARRMRAANQLVAHLGFGESPFPIPESMRTALSESAGEKGYLPGEGLPELRRAAASFMQRVWSTDFGEEHIFVGPGSKELLFDLFAVLSGPLLIPTPAWVSYAPQAQLLRKPMVPMPTSVDTGYRLQPSVLQAYCRASPGQKILILNNPVNPTGAVYSPAELGALAKVCRAEDVIVIADEIYGLINFGKVNRCSMAALLPERTVVTTGLSKIFAAGGWRLGIAAVPDALSAIAKPLRAMISETFSCVSAPVQYGAIPAFEYGKDVQTFVELTTRIHSAAAEYVASRFLEMGLDCPTPEGAFYLFPSFDPYTEGLRRMGIHSSEALCEALLSQAGVATLPGSDFGLSTDKLAIRVATVDYDGLTALGEFETNPSVDGLFPNLVAGCDALDAFLSGVS